jgi:hypothetical protein
MVAMDVAGPSNFDTRGKNLITLVEDLYMILYIIYIKALSLVYSVMIFYLSFYYLFIMKINDPQAGSIMTQRL